MTLRRVKLFSDANSVVEAVNFELLHLSFQARDVAA